MKVLILSTGTGEGHNSAAKAVKEQFEKRGIPCELADVLNFASDKAGAYGIQGRAALMVRRLEGDYFNVMGLPLCRLGQMLEEIGVHLF